LFVVVWNIGKMIYLFRKGDEFNKYIDDAKEYVGESSKQDS